MATLITKLQGQEERPDIFFKTGALIAVALGAVAILYATAYTIHITYDSWIYISAARSLAAGSGFLRPDGTFEVLRAPLYPAALAGIYAIFGVDPIDGSRYVGAFSFAASIWLSFLLARRYYGNQVGLLMAFLVLLSEPLITISSMAWTESLFILLTLCFLWSADQYIAKPNKKNVVPLILLSALASLTRFIGVVLFPVGEFLILMSKKIDWKEKVSHLVLFSFSAFPIILWAFRNLFLSGYFFGPRVPSKYTLAENISFIAQGMVSFHGLLLLVTLLFAMLSRSVFQSVPGLVRRTAVPMFFTAVYLVFLLYTSTTIVYDQIDNRLLSPIYIPSLLVIAALALRCFQSLNGFRRLSFTFILAIIIGGSFLISYGKIKYFNSLKPEFYINQTWPWEEYQIYDRLEIITHSSDSLDL